MFCQQASVVRCPGTVRSAPSVKKNLAWRSAPDSRPNLIARYSNDGTKKPEQGLDHGLALAIERRGLVMLLYLASCSELVTTDCVLDYFCVDCGVLCGVCIVGRELCATSAVAGHVPRSTRADRTGMPKSDRRKMSGSCLPCYIAT
jgi:hypothetical protein